MKQENMLPVNAFYITALRDKRGHDRPKAQWVDKETGEVLRQRSRLDSLDILIYIMLLSRADKDKYTCYPSLATIASDCPFAGTKICEQCPEGKYIEAEREGIREG